MVVELHNDGFVFVLLPHDRLIDWTKLRRILHVNRLHLAHAAAALKATGFPRGAISPLGSTKDWPVFVDELLIGKQTLRLGGGELDTGILVDGPAFIHAFAATIAEFTRTPKMRETPSGALSEEATEPSAASMDTVTATLVPLLESAASATI